MQDIIIESSNQSSSVAANVRKVHSKKSDGAFHYVFAWIIKGLFVFLLLGIDFLLFAGSGNQTIFMDGSIQPEILTCLTVLLIVSLLVMFVVSFSSILQNLLASIVMGGFVLALLNQFALYDKTSILEPMLSPYIGMSSAFIFNGISDWVLAGGAAVLTFVILFFSSKGNVAYFTGILLVIFSGILVDDYLNKKPTDEFIVRYDNHLNKATANPRKYVYVFLPNATSYITLGEMKDQLGNVSQGEELKGKLLAFLAKNDFWVYPNAYVHDSDGFDNMVVSLNNIDDKRPQDNILKNVKIKGLWNFSDVQDEYVFMRNAKLIDVYKNSRYAVTAMQSRGIDICSKNNTTNVDKCIDKFNTPVAVDNINGTHWDKSAFLLVQWLNSLHFVSDWSTLYGMLDGFVAVNEWPIVGVSYDSLYVVNSFKAFDKLLNEIEQDKGNRAYFVFVDLPSDMYVYDEYCQLKPQAKWMTMDNYKWVNNKNLFAKRKAYLDQYSCLIGKLEQFMGELHNRKLDKNTVIFLQGINGINELGGAPTEDYIENFKRQNLVLLAVKDPSRKNFSINNQICESREIVRNYLYRKGDCTEFNGMGLHETAAKGLQDNLLSNVLSKDTLNGYLKDYDIWYQMWKGKNSLKNNAINKEIKAIHQENSAQENKKLLKNSSLTNGSEALQQTENAAPSKDNKEVDTISSDNDITTEEGADNESELIANDNKPENIPDDGTKVVDLPEERAVGEAKVMAEPLQEGEEQPVKSIKDEIQKDIDSSQDTKLENNNNELNNRDIISEKQTEASVEQVDNMKSETAKAEEIQKVTEEQQKTTAEKVSNSQNNEQKQ